LVTVHDYVLYVQMYGNTSCPLATGLSFLAQQHVTDALRPENALGVGVVMEQIAVQFKPYELALQWGTDCRENRLDRFHMVSCGVTPFA